MSLPVPVPVFVGYDPHERAAVNVLIDSLYQHSSVPLAITPIVTAQLADVFPRERSSRQSTEFSFTRFPVSSLHCSGSSLLSGASGGHTPSFGSLDRAVG
jgi:hypothetical protein